MEYYIKLLDTLCLTERHELIVDMLDYFGVNGVSELTAAQVREFYERIVA